MVLLLGGPAASPALSQGRGAAPKDQPLEWKVPQSQIKIGPPQWKGAPPQGDKAAAPATANVKDMYFGAKGDGARDDTASIQSAVDFVHARGGGTIIFPPGTYLVTSVNLREGITYQGVGEAVIKRPDQLFQKQKFPRTFTNQKYAYYGEKDSAPIIFKNLVFDGNSQNQGPYKKYEQEHADLLFLTARRDSPGRLQVVIEDCLFRNSVSDGISIYKNVDVKVNNCTAIDCFRGGFLILGGNTRAVLTNYTGKGKNDPAGIDVELSGDSEGYGNSTKVEFYMENINLPDGVFDIGLGFGSKVVGKNIYSHGFFNLVAPGSTVTLSHCKFGIPPGARIVWPHRVTFEHCEFTALGNKDKPPALQAAPFIAWNLSGTSEKNQSVTFINCKFNVADGVAPETKVNGIATGRDGVDYHNILTVQGGNFSKRINEALAMYRGGHWRIKDAVVESALPFAWTGFKDSFGDAYADIVIDGATIKTKKYMAIGGYPDKNHPNRLEHKNLEMDESANYISSFYGLEGNQYAGHRVIWGSAPPTPATHGLVGDIYRLKDSPAEWVCTKAGYYYEREKKQIMAEWQPRKPS